MLATSASPHLLQRSTNSPARHQRILELLGVPTNELDPVVLGEMLSDRLVEILRQFQLPNGLEALGYSSQDLDRLVGGAEPQQRLTKLAPRVATTHDLHQLLNESLRIW